LIWVEGVPFRDIIHDEKYIQNHPIIETIPNPIFTDFSSMRVEVDTNDDEFLNWTSYDNYIQEPMEVDPPTDHEGSICSSDTSGSIYDLSEYVSPYQYFESSALASTYPAYPTPPSTPSDTLSSASSSSSLQTLNQYPSINTRLGIQPKAQASLGIIILTLGTEAIQVRSSCSNLLWRGLVAGLKGLSGN
jgi:hypothetical protein